MISDVKPFFRARLNLLGYREWRDMNFKNIPQGVLNEKYHIDLGNSFGIQNNQDNQDIETEITIRLFRAPTNDPIGQLDKATEIADTVLADILSSRNRTTQASGMRNVRFNSLAIDPIDPSNDNGLEIRIALTAHVIISTR